MSSLEKLGSKSLGMEMPIMLEVSKFDFGPKPFKCFDTWLSGDDVEDLIKKEWCKEAT